MGSRRPPYSYDPLPDGEFIRLLTIHPGTGTELLSCSLTTMPLIDASPFEGISYVWGHSARDTTLHVDGCELLITGNLHDALMLVRLSTRDRIVWADSVCINQADPEEQSHQVAIMGRIYRAATRVLLIFGRSHPGVSEDARSLVADVNAMIEATLPTIDGSFGSFPAPKKNEPLVTDRRWVTAMHSLLGNAWFSRGWVVQEAALAKEAMVIWGNVIIPWAHILRTYHWAYHMAPQIIFQFKVPMVNQLHLLTMRLSQPEVVKTMKTELAWDYGKPSATQILQFGRKFGFADTRDRIYAFLPFIERFTGEPFQLITPDYNRHFLDIYTDFARHFILHAGDTHLLDYVQHTEGTIDSDVPSWVPRWDAEYTWVGIGGPKIMSTTGQPVPPLFVGEKALKVRGVVLEPIVYASSVLHHLDTSREDVIAIMREIQTKKLKSTYPAEYWPLEFMSAMGQSTYVGSWDSWVANRNAYMEDLRKEVARQKTGIGALRKLFGRPTESKSSSAIGDADFFHRAALNVSHNHRIVVTRSGLCGLASDLAKIGDVPAIIFGTSMPLLLRPTDKAEHYRLIAPAALSSRHPVYVGSDPDYRTLGPRYGPQDWVEDGIPEQDIFLV